jgi:hypothetical protein
LSNVETIRVKDFTTLPGARYKEDGDGSAEEFFEKYVKEKLEKDDKILIDFDGTWGYASSFLSELALRIANKYQNNNKDIRASVKIKSEDESGLVERFWGYVDESLDKNN